MKVNISGHRVGLVYAYVFQYLYYILIENCLDDVLLLQKGCFEVEAFVRGKNKKALFRFGTCILFPKCVLYFNRKLSG